MAASRVGSPANIRFAVKKPTLVGDLPFVTPNVVFREVLLNSQEATPGTGPSHPSSNTAPVVVPDDSRPGDTDYEGPYDDLFPEHELFEDEGPDCAPIPPAGRRLRPVQGQTPVGSSFPSQDDVVSSSLPIPPYADYDPPMPIGWDGPRCEYEQIREDNIKVLFYW